LEKLGRFIPHESRTSSWNRIDHTQDSLTAPLLMRLICREENG
jgi:hypothetical protein